MRFRFCFVFVVFYFAAVLIFAIYLRNAESRVFYKLYMNSDEQSWLKLQLCQKQLQLEMLINPPAVSQRLEE
jgi:hypothetical protein